jgi:FAD/FMN-containing dehydrogenase
MGNLKKRFLQGMARPRENSPYQSWGRYPKAYEQTPVRLTDRAQSLPALSQDTTMLAYGMGRSYGDSCLNDPGHIILTRNLDHLLDFDRTTGILTAEAGVTLEEVLSISVPAGFFLPVTPGTKFVTLGGAVANDVHGKNHHIDGNFSHHVLAFELLRSDGSRLICSESSNSEFFYATIGGLGLTGLITWVKVQLKPVTSAFISQEVIKTENLADFLALNAASDRDFLYTVSWIDCLARGKNLGRGLFMRGNHTPKDLAPKSISRSGKKSIPIDLPSFVLNGLTVKTFNALYYNRQLGRKSSSVVHYDPFFYPLDAVHHWNRIYGKRGFLQWQCVVPTDRATGEDAIKEILREISKAGMGSFLAVLKTFGPKPSLGMMSFPRAGITVALDFPNKGPKLLKLLERLDTITREAHGSIYAAKDARMSPESFRVFYPRVEEFMKFLDPKFSSSFWRRVTGGK